MYLRDALAIGRKARRCPDTFARCGLFVLCSIRVRFPLVSRDFDKVMAGDTSPLYGWKAKAWADLSDNRSERLSRLLSIANEHGSAELARDELLAEVCTWTGFGPAKAGFLLQMVFNVSGCLDSRNLENFDIDGATVKSRNFKRRENLLAYAAKYHAQVDELGGTETLWNYWCAEYAANFQGSKVRPDLRSPSDFSREHSRIVLGA
jgi:hypothetical protein